MGDGIECTNSFHFMDENGYYAGWGDFAVKIFHHKRDVLNPLKGPNQGKIQVVHRKGDIDFKLVCRGSEWRRNVAYGVDDYLHESIDYALRNILTRRSHELIDAS